MPRKLLEWKLKNETWRLGERTLLEGAELVVIGAESWRSQPRAVV
jgi:hypothetical protein